MSIWEIEKKKEEDDYAVIKIRDLLDSDEYVFECFDIKVILSLFGNQL
jgi:hypothetical protein